MDHLDDRVKKEILNHTEDNPSTLKDDIWNHIDKELFQTKNRREKKKKFKVISVFITTAAAVMILFSTQTESGNAFIKQLKDIFVPEKEIIQSIEGNEEETKVNLQEGKNSDYIIYIDEERYKLVPGETSDFITTKEPLEEKYPDVSMEIKQYPDIEPQEMVSTLETELASQYTKVTETESVTKPVEGFKMHGISGSEWDSPVTNIYVLDNLNGGSFVITEKYFLEAAEGHGARFYAMLQEFKVVE